MKNEVTYKPLDKQRICAIVSTFNRKEILLKCLSALLEQRKPLDCIIIVDGPSIDGTPELLLKKGFINKLPPTSSYNNMWMTSTIYCYKEQKIKIFYVRIYHDIGGAGQFYEGLKLAYAYKYDWIWLMDDDAYPEPDALEKLVLATAGNELVIARPSIKEDDVDELIFAPFFAGGLFSRQVIKVLGLPLKDLFIYWDDVEYIMRIEKLKIKRYIKIINVKDAKIKHKDWVLRGKISKKVFGLKISAPLHPKGRKYYYIQRNGLYVYARNGYVIKFFFFFISSMRLLVKYMILRQHEKVFSIIKGTIDAFLHKMGKQEFAHKKSNIKEI